MSQKVSSSDELRRKGEPWSVVVEIPNAQGIDSSIAIVRPPDDKHNFFVESIHVQLPVEVSTTQYELELVTPKRSYFKAPTNDDGLALAGLIDKLQTIQTVGGADLWKGDIDLKGITTKAYYSEPDNETKTNASGAAGAWEVKNGSVVTDIGSSGVKPMLIFKGYLIRKNIG